MADVQPETQFICKVCDRICPSKTALHQHLRNATHWSSKKVQVAPAQEVDNKPSEVPVNHHHCGICNKTLSTAHGLRLHNASKHASKKAETKQDISESKDTNNLHNDLSKLKLTHDEPKGIPAHARHCAVCSKMFNGPNGLALHNATEHNPRRAGPKKNIPSTMPKDTSFDCHLCTGSFHHLSSLQQHRRMKHASEKAPTATSKGIQTGTETVPQIQIRKCPTCDKGFRTKRGVKAHIKAVHAAQAKRSEQGAKEENRAVAKQSASASLEPGTIDTPKEEENNDVAENTLADNPGSKKVTEKQKPYCRACNKPFRSQAALEGHERLKHKKNIPRPAQNQESNYEEAFPYACHACGKSFRLESALADHNANKHDFGRACLPTSYSRPVVYHPGSAYNLYDSDDEGYTDDDSDDDSDDDFTDDGLPWPEHGEPGPIDCIGRGLGCRQRFSTASDMIRHTETGRCETWLEHEDWHGIFNGEMGKAGRQTYQPNSVCRFRCPECKDKQRDFRHLSGLFKHAESDACGLKVRSGPLYDVNQAMLSYVLDLMMTFDDDSDDMYNSDDSYDSDDPLGKYKYDSFDDWANNYGEVSASYLAQYGY